MNGIFPQLHVAPSLARKLRQGLMQGVLGDPDDDFLAGRRRQVSRQNDTQHPLRWLSVFFLSVDVYRLPDSGRLAVDRFGGKVVNAGGIALWSAATVLTGFSIGFVSMAASRVVMGMGESTRWPACNRIIREWFPASEDRRRDLRSVRCRSPPWWASSAGVPGSILRVQLAFSSWCYGGRCSTRPIV
jgi:hypothetical protein